MSTKHFIVTGAPGVGKTDLANQLLNERFTDAVVVGSAWSTVDPDDYPLGVNADYRLEMLLASRRVLDHLIPRPTVVFHDGSLLDNLAYAYTRLDLFRKHRATDVDEISKHILTGGLLSVMLADSLKAEHVFFIKADLDEQEDWERHQVQTNLGQILMDVGLLYTVLEGNPDTWAETAGQIVENELGKGRATSKSETTQD